MSQNKLPVRVVTNQPYGEAGQQQASQAQIPLAPPPTPGAAMAPPSAPPPAAAPPAPPQGPLPGELGSLTAPTQRPNEPLTHGISTGPGGGPEVLGNFNRSGNLGSTLSQLAQASGNSDLQVLAQRALSLGQ